MDIVDDNATLPVREDGKLLAKVSRLGLDGVVAVNKPSAGAAQQRAGAPAQVAPAVQKPAAAAPTEVLLQHESPVAVQRKSQPERRNSDKLISFDTFDDAPAAAGAFSIRFLLY